MKAKVKAMEELNTVMEKDEELNNRLCSILSSSNVYIDRRMFDKAGFVFGNNIPKEIKFIPYIIVDTDN